jgi:hypothetical protein
VPETVGCPARLCVRRDQASRGEQDRTPDELGTVCRETAGDAIAERMAHDVRRGCRERLDHPGDIRREVVEAKTV